MKITNGHVMRIGSAVGLMMFASLPATAGPPDFDPSRASATCEESWTKRGTLDQEMYDYCMRQQTDGYARTLDLMEKYRTIPDIEGIADFASGKWLTRREYQYEMVAYEIEQQAEAFLDVAYDVDAGKYSESGAADCMARWISDAEPLWDMVAYCLKND
jgi:hypothetical protein